MLKPNSLESQARRIAKKCGLRAVKSRRGISVDNCGEFRLVDDYCNRIVAGEKFDLTVEDVREYCRECSEGLSRPQAWNAATKLGMAAVFSRAVKPECGTTVCK